MHATFFGANGWLLEFGGLRVFVDPWLTGPLQFAPGPWFFEGTLNHPQPVPPQLDLLLLTQALPDHTHAESLALLPSQLPVVASPAAAARARQLGFAQVHALAPSERFCLAEPAGAGVLEILATAGAPVPQVENGYLLRHPAGSVYLEPHGYLPPDLPPQPLDAVITPVVDLGLPVAGAFVRGQQVLPQLLERFSPRTVLASSAGEEVSYGGWLSRILWQRGSVAEAARQVAGHHGATGPDGTRATCRLIAPEPGVRYALA
jgi:L-ascorbate metabolism protein UlaG (beta-lactamase superfamily)